MTAAAYQIELIEDPHGYLVNGEPKRSWSEIKNALYAHLGIEELPSHPAVLRHIANARARGAQIDDACSLIMEGRPFDLDSLHEESLPYVWAFSEYWLRHGQRPKALHVQTPLYCAELDFCTTPDFHTIHGVYDVKATDRPSRAWGLQTAAQQLAHGVAYSRHIVWLRPRLKTRHYELHRDGIGADPRIFSELDHLVVRAAARGEYDAECILRWKEAGR